MRSSTAEILETALALQRAPGERFRLRERPLPEGIVYLLEIASGSPQALATAAAEIGHDEQEVLGAARFYLEQILFAAEDGDAYRVLGLAPNAPQDTIRTHHRWLQRWLHPDRAQAGDATVFATRVNQAWSQLRTPELRHDYDVRLAEARLAGADAPLPADTLHRWEQTELAPAAHGRRSRWLLATALVACAVLAVLIVRHQETIAPWEQHHDNDVAAAVDPGPAMDDSDVGILAEALVRASEAQPNAGAAEATNPPEAPEAGTGSREQGMATVSRVALDAPEVGPSPVAVAQPRVSRVATLAIAPASIISTASTVKAAKPEPKPAAPAKPPVERLDPKVLVMRMQLAEKRMAQVTDYLADRPGAAPLWNDPQVEVAARQVRERIKPRRGAKLELIEPQWRLQRDNASISTGYRVRSDGGAGQGTLDVQLVWREGLWLVRGVELAPAA